MLVGILNVGTLGLALVVAVGSTAGCKRNRCPEIPADTATPKTVAATVAGETITIDEVDRVAGHRLHQARTEALEEILVERILRKEAQRSGMSVQQVFDKKLAERVPVVSEAEARSWLTSHPERLPRQFAGKPFEEIKDFLIAGLTGERRAKAKSGVMEALKAEAKVQVLLGPARAQLAAKGPERGPANAPVSVVIYSDFQCPFCAQASKTLTALEKVYPTQVRIVFRDFPLSFHPDANTAAAAGICANEQDPGKFWQLHDWMFGNQDHLKREDLGKAARTLGLAGELFDRCMDNPKTAALVEDSVRAGKEAGVEATPTFLVNGVLLQGAQPLQKLREVVDQALTKVGAAGAAAP